MLTLRSHTTLRRPQPNWRAAQSVKARVKPIKNCK